MKKLWNRFISENPFYENKKQPISFCFCDNKKDADDCAELVVKGIKKATSSSFWSYKATKTPIPKVGDFNIVTDWNGNTQAIIEIIKVELIPYNQITEKFAQAEGEGNRSLEHWKQVHKKYFSKECLKYNKKFDENMIIVCEHFEKK